VPISLKKFSDAFKAVFRSKNPMDEAVKDLVIHDGKIPFFQHLDYLRDQSFKACGIPDGTILPKDPPTTILATTAENLTDEDLARMRFEFEKAHRQMMQDPSSVVVLPSALNFVHLDVPIDLEVRSEWNPTPLPIWMVHKLMRKPGRW